MSKEQYQPKGEHDSFFTFDLRDSIEEFFANVPGNESSTVPIRATYPGMMLSLKPAAHEESGFISVERKQTDDDLLLYTVRLTDNDGEEYAQIGMLVNPATREPVGAPLGGGADVTDTLMSAMLEGSLNNFLGDK